MPTMKTPGVYIEEINAFPNSVVAVPTAIAAFVGYTERADENGKDWLMQPLRLTSFAEFTAIFGEAPKPEFRITNNPPDTPLPVAQFTSGGDMLYLSQTEPAFCLHAAIRHFFLNGGRNAYVVAVGHYDAGTIGADTLIAGITALEAEQEPTLLIVPESTRLSAADSARVHRAMLHWSGATQRNRFAILDIRNGHLPLSGVTAQPVDTFRADVSGAFLSHGAAYYPWLTTTLTDATAITFSHIANDSRDAFVSALKGSVTPLPAAAATALDAIGADATDAVPPADTDATLRATCPLYTDITAKAAQILNALPPGAAMAGIYTQVDTTRGVWKAPANVSVAAVAAPVVTVSHAEQQGLNVSTTGKSVNAIRSFAGTGTLVWGARTLDSNSVDWRYVSVRRTVSMIDESLRVAMGPYVFEPNTPKTWVNIRAMLENFLTTLWKQGAFQGTTPDQAFSVRIGLGETMTPADILDGMLRVDVMLAPTRPAEFIVISLTQQMQKA